MTSHVDFHDNSIMAKGDNDITKFTGTTILQTSSAIHLAVPHLLLIVLIWWSPTI